MNTAFLKTFQVLQSVYADKAFSSIALNKVLLTCPSKDKPLVTKMVYGVLEQDAKLGYILSNYVRKMPKGQPLIILKMGIFALTETSIPVYAVVNDLAELAKVTEDKRMVGFVNATLKQISCTVKTFDNWPQEEVQRLAVQYSYPEWVIRKLIKDYGKDTMIKKVSYRLENTNTVRVHGISSDCARQTLGASPTCFEDAFKVASKVEQNNFVTFQSLSSMAVARIAANCGGGKFLDCCAAPGGKSVYVAQLRPDMTVTSCDIHPHRVQLIEDYAARMNTKLETFCKDMTQFFPQWEKQFDVVLCDVPCSGFGVTDSRPDIKIFRQNEDISHLMKLQAAILNNCSNYVKVGGKLVYSTCTIFDNENGQIVRRFLKEHANFAPSTICLPQLPQADGKHCYQFLPHKDNMQGFFVAVLERVG